MTNPDSLTMGLEDIRDCMNGLTQQLSVLIENNQTANLATLEEFRRATRGTTLLVQWLIRNREELNP